MSNKSLKSGAESDIIALLLQHGADPYLISSEQNLSPLGIAVYRKAFAVAQEVIASTPVGCDINGEVCPSVLINLNCIRL